MTKHAGKISPKLILSLLGLMFIIPLSVAWLMHSGVIEYRPGGGVNRGELIDPPVAGDLPDQYLEEGLTDHWVIAHIPPETCPDTCQELIYGIRQVYKALGRDATRVRLLLLTDANAMMEDLPEIAEPDSGFTVLSTNTGKLSQQFESLGDRHGIFIIDPLGNIMMRYASETSPNDILIDMERLLQYQKTDPQ